MGRRRQGEIAFCPCEGDLRKQLDDIGAELTGTQEAEPVPLRDQVVEPVGIRDTYPLALLLTLAGSDEGAAVQKVE